MPDLIIVATGVLHDGRGGGPEKALTEGLRKNGGRNNTGRVTVRHRGGGEKRCADGVAG